MRGIEKKQKSKVRKKKREGRRILAVFANLNPRIGKVLILGF